MALPDSVAQVATPARTAARSNGSSLGADGDQRPATQGSELMAALGKQLRRVEAGGMEYVKMRGSRTVGYVGGSREDPEDRTFSLHVTPRQTPSLQNAGTPGCASRGGRVSNASSCASSNKVQGSPCVPGSPSSQRSSQRNFLEGVDMLDIPDEELLTAVAVLAKIAEARNLAPQLQGIERGRQVERQGLARSSSPVSKLDKLFSPRGGQRESARSEPAALHKEGRRKHSRVRFDPDSAQDDRQEECDDEEEEKVAARMAAAAARAANRKRRLSRGLGGAAIEAPGFVSGASASAEGSEDEDGTATDHPSYSITNGLKQAAYGAGVGAMYGAVPALFTFGLSIPVCATANALRHGYKGLTQADAAPTQSTSRCSSPVRGRSTARS